MANETTPMFGIFGWKEDGGPLLRPGFNWMTFSGLTRKQIAAIKGLEVGQSADTVFNTHAGPISYRVERMA